MLLLHVHCKFRDFSNWELPACSTVVTVQLSPSRCLSDWSAYQGETEVTLNTTVLDPLTGSNLTLVTGAELVFVVSGTTYMYPGYGIVYKNVPIFWSLPEYVPCIRPHVPCIFKYRDRNHVTQFSAIWRQTKTLSLYLKMN